MLETIKSYIRDTEDIPFGEFYQDYICRVQDQNVAAEMNGVKTDDIVSVKKLIEKLKGVLY